MQSARATVHAVATTPLAHVQRQRTDLNPSTSAVAAATAARAQSPVGRRPARAAKAPKISCEDCYFHQNHLCALDVDKPCPTFRAAADGLKAPQQLSFVFRQERTRSAWVFAQPR